MINLTKKNLPKFLIGIALSHFLAFNYLYAQTGKWTMVKSPSPHPNMGVCLLMTDGTVICHNLQGGNYGTGWDRLTPDIHGSYVNGTWDTIAPMNNDRLFFSSQVLPSGKVYVAGGEYGPGGPAGEVYDPVTNTWTMCDTIPAGWNIFDGNSELLANGNVLEGPQIGNHNSFNCLTWSPITNKYSFAPNALYNHDEAPWLKLKDSSILFVGIANDSSNRYIQKTNTWINDGVVPGYLYDGLEEAGGAHLLPNGKAVFFGATPFNAIYTPSGNINPGTWAAADSFPVIQGCYVGQSDASSAMMVNGHILLAVSPVNACVGMFQPPCYFLEYDYLTNKFTQVTDTIPGMGGNDSIPIPSYQTQMLDLPDGTVLLSISQEPAYSNTYYVYTPGSGPIPQGKPTINSITKINCNNYSITGKLFNGISEGASFGDDWQMATNYPIIRITNGTNVYYAKSYNWNRIGAVATDSLEDTAYFTVPPMPGGTYSLVVVANGFASNPTTITIYGVSITSQINVACNGGSTGRLVATASGGSPVYHYLWSPVGGTGDTAKNLSAGTYTVTVIDGNSCTATASATITQPDSLNIVAYQNSYIRCHGANTGGATANAAGGTPSYTYLWSGGGGTNASATGLSAGTYTVIVSDSCGATKSATVNINQPPALLIHTDSIDSWSVPCNGKAIVTVSGGMPTYNYLWTPGGQTTDTVKGLCPGNYCCKVRDTNGCLDSACVSVVEPVENVQQETGQITVYPVPNNGNFIIDMKGNGIKGYVEIYNVLSEKIYYQLSNYNIQFVINLSSQPSGIYFYRVINEDGSLFGEGKFIIDK